MKNKKKDTNYGQQKAEDVGQHSKPLLQQDPVCNSLLLQAVNITILFLNYDMNY